MLFLLSKFEDMFRLVLVEYNNLFKGKSSVFKLLYSNTYSFLINVFTEETNKSKNVKIR